MAIASNFRKHAQAMALQLCLPFARALVWNGARPTSRLGRLHRAARSAAAKAIGRIVYPEPKTYAPKPRDPRKVIQSTCLVKGDPIGTAGTGRWFRPWVSSPTPVWP